MCACEPTQTQTPTPTILRELAEAAARVGGNLARQRFGHSLQVTLKADNSEVTDVDIAAEEAIIACIRAQRADDLFIGEEAAGNTSPTGASNSNSIYWIIDPIDGTRNYVRSMPLFACSVAAMRAGHPVAGAVYDPIQDTMYSAASGEGLFVNDRHHHPNVKERDEPGKQLYVGIPSARRDATKTLVLRTIEEHVVRNFGSVALHLALTSIGHLDATVVGNAKLWDIAAGCLLVTEGGGLVTTPSGGPLFPLDLTRYDGDEMPLLAADQDAHSRLLSLD